MKVSISWLKRHVDLPEDAETIEKALTSVGLEVEGKEEPGKVYEKLIVAKVLTCEPHPDSDHLHVTTVNDGKETIQVVCGAPNVAAGQTVVLAPLGAELPTPDGKSIKMKKAKMRGVESFGMLCAEDEIGVSNDHGGIMVLDDKIPAGTPFVSLGYYDTTFEVNVTPNRPDALSHRGVARELAAKFNRPLKPLQYTLSEDSAEASSAIKLEVEPGCGCSRYVGRVIRDVKVGPSPEWLSKLLRSVGMSSVNNVVDITNFILMDIGQPLHSFDMDKLSGNTVRVRRARKGEKITTLDHKDHELTGNDLVICDGDRPACVAGVMGGVESEITETTKNVFLESAYFNPTIVRKQSKRLGIATDSSYRFERDIDFAMQAEADAYASALIQEVAGGKVLKSAVEYTGADHQQKPFKVHLRENRVEKVLGVHVSAGDIRKYLTSIGLRETDNDLTFSIPTFRPDLTREVDLIEEIARLVGFDNIPYDTPDFRAKPNDLPAQEILNRRIRYALAAMGLHECLSLRFTSKANVEKVFGAPNAEDRRSRPAALLNPLSEDLGVLPTSLIPMLLKSVADNEKSRPGSVRLFEVGKGQYPEQEKRTDRDPGFEETPLLCATIAGHWRVNALEEKPAQVSFADLKGLIISLFKRLGLSVTFSTPAKPEVFLHPGRQAEIVCGNTVIGTAGMVHPAILNKFEISYETGIFEADLNKVEKARRTQVTFKPFSRQVFTTRDISMEVDAKATHESILRMISGFKAKDLVSVELKSIYQGDKIAAGKKNMVYTFVYQSPDTTLTDDEVNKAHNKLREKIAQDGSIVLR